jgi:hypothetical protein
VEKKNIEYYLLKNARENVFSRGLLLDIDFFALEQMEQGTWRTKIRDQTIPLVRNTIQIDIISKIMMYIEDLVVLAASLLEEKNFYEEFLSPSSGDLGGAIKCFFKNIERLSDEEILKIRSSIDMPSVMPSSQLAMTAKKVQDIHIKKFRSDLKELRDFGESNHLIYKRFKHGGMPITNATVTKAPAGSPLSIFDTCSIVSVGDNPLQDIAVIPSSSKVLQRYQKLVVKIQQILIGIIDNRFTALQREIPSIFPNKPLEGLISAEEVALIEEERLNFFEAHPVKFDPPWLDIDKNLPDIKRRIRWYFETYPD